jgi:hypothetical protein
LQIAFSTDVAVLSKVLTINTVSFVYLFIICLASPCEVVLILLPYLYTH